MNDESQVSVAERMIRFVIWTLLYAFPLGVALLPIFDQDIWWHLRTGQWLIEHRGLPATDPFSRLGLETAKPLIVYSWLFEVIVALFHQFLGLAGIVLLRALMTVAIVAAVHQLIAKREPRFAFAAGLTGLGVLAVTPLLTERPWLFTILFALITLDVIHSVREGGTTRAIWLLPILFVLWANIHIQFVYGLFMLGLAAASLAFVRAVRPCRTLIALTVLCTLATLVNPYHVGLYQVVLHYATQRAPLVHVFEMQSLEFRKLWDWAVLGLACWGAFQLARRNRVSPFELLFLAAGAWFAFRSRRDAWFMLIGTCAAVLTTGVAARQVRSFTPRARQGVVLAGLVLSIGTYLWFTRVTDKNIELSLAKHYPVRAAEIVKERGYTGPLYNSYNWGGYLMCQLPELPVCMDGRANVYGDALLDRSMTTWLGYPSWKDDPDLAAAGVVIFEADAPLVSLLRLDPRFKIVHEDDVATVFIPWQRQKVASR